MLSVALSLWIHSTYLPNISIYLICNIFLNHMISLPVTVTRLGWTVRICWTKPLTLSSPKPSRKTICALCTRTCARRLRTTGVLSTANRMMNWERYSVTFSWRGQCSECECVCGCVFYITCCYDFDRIGLGWLTTSLLTNLINRNVT